MNDPMATPVHTKPNRSNRAPGKQDSASLRRDNQAQGEFDWIKDKRTFREALLYWCNIGHSLYSSLTKPRLSKGYYAFIENLDLSRGQAIFLIVMVLVSGRVSYKVTTNLINNMPDVDFISPAQASEHLPISNIHNKEDLGEFLEDCY